MSARLTKDEYYLDIAESVSERSTCLRRHYGAIIVKNDVIVSSGYNGAPRGSENCCDRGTCKREDLGVAHGERYDLCDAVHAEQNAIINAARQGSSVLGGTLYIYGYDMKEHRTITAMPCMMCSRVIKNAGIARILVSKEEAETCMEGECMNCGDTRSDLCGCCPEHCHADKEDPEGKETGRKGSPAEEDHLPEARG